MIQGMLRATLYFTATAMLLSGCNTFAGMGRDIAYTGNSVVKWSTDMREEIPSTGYVAEDANKLMITDAEGNLIKTMPEEEAADAEGAEGTYGENTLDAKIKTSNASDDATAIAAQKGSDNSSTNHTPGYSDSSYHKPRYYQYQPAK